MQKLHLLPPLKVAEELLLIDSSALRKIQPDELADEAWVGKRKVSSIELACACAGLKSYICCHMYNRSCLRYVTRESVSVCLCARACVYAYVCV